MTIAQLVGGMLGLAMLLLLVDRLLLWTERRGWINYRRNGLSRPGALYHALELQSIFDPSIRSVIEISYEEKKNQDDAGDPLKRGPGVDAPRAVLTNPSPKEP
jgi:hypothetical protein